ncbi:GAF domain-containing protein [Streptomyces sp. NPDC020883]|uniref:GAF domain-containing protein n=1 Tax=Streptomyces sp. NPDC020883 TaxID=3365099 RepID=UPI0037AB1112
MTHTTRPLKERFELLRTFGLDRVDPRLDEMAAALADEAGMPYAMINIFHPATGGQHFVGLAAPRGGRWPTVQRTMAPDWGYCPEVPKKNGRALILPDVYEMARFAGNPVVDALGIRTYAGAPIVLSHSTESGAGVMVGTVCFVGTTPQPDEAGQAMAELVKRHRDEITRDLFQHAGLHPPELLPHRPITTSTAQEEGT